MSVPYERIVAEDFNTGRGTVSVSMPGGGSATGNKVGLHTWMGLPAITADTTGGGSTDDQEAVQDAIDYQSDAGGGSVFLKHPVIGVGSKLTVRDGVYLRGHGMMGTKLKRLSGFTSGETVLAQAVYCAMEDLIIDNNNVAGNGLRIFGGNYGYYDRVRIINVTDDGVCATLAGAGSNTFKSCLFHAADGQGFVMENGASVSTALTFMDVSVITAHETLQSVVLDGAFNCRWFGGQISADEGPGLLIQNCTGVHVYGLYMETSGAGVNAFPVEILSSGDVNFDGGVFSDNLNTVPIFKIRDTANRVRIAGKALVGRETADGTQLIDIVTPASGVVAHTIEDVSFRCSVSHTTVFVTGTVPALLTLRQLHDRGAGAGSIIVLARDSYIGQTPMPITLSTGSLKPVTLDGCRGTITDTDFAANEIGTDNIGTIHGSGSPEGVVSANLGEIYINTAGGVGTTMYVKQQNAGGNTGWASVT